MSAIHVRCVPFSFIQLYFNCLGMSDVDDDDLDDDSLMMDDRTDPNRVGARRDSLPSQVLGE